MPEPSKLIARAIGGRQVIDAAEVRRALALLADPAAAFQVNGPPSWRPLTWSAANLDVVAKTIAERMDGRRWVFFTLNPVRPGLEGYANATHMLSRRWLMVDADAKRSDTKVMATEDEHEAARQLAARVMDHLSERGWPSPVLIDSGNGFHLLYRVDLGTDRHAAALCGAVLRKLRQTFADAQGAHIDPETNKVTQATKLPGTWVCKGQNTPGRPWRRAKLLLAPESPEIVTAGQLGEYAGVSSAPSLEPARQESPFRAYCRRALEGETARVYLATPGGEGGTGRNDTLFDAARKMARYAAGGGITWPECVTELSRAASEIGLPDREIEGILKRAQTIGSQQPKQAPERNGRPSRSAPPPRPEPKAEGGQEDEPPLTIGLAEVQPLRVDWLVPDRMPKRFITVFAGRTGLGKSFVALDLISRMSRGREIPFRQGECFRPGGTLLVSEDSHEYVIAPRLIEMGADLSQIRAMTWGAMAQYNLGDIKMLERACSEVECPQLVMIDPPTNFLGGADEHRNAEVRQVVMNVVEWVMQRDLACLFILHVNKQTGKGIEALNRVLGSVAWVTTSRIAHSFSKDPDDKTRCLWCPMKNNLGILARGLAYRIVGRPSGSAIVEWLGEVETTADEAMAGEKATPRRVVASEWLIERFREKLEWGSDELFAAARRDNVSRNSLFDAKYAMHLPKARRNVLANGDVVHLWWVPADWPMFAGSRERQPGEDDEG